MTTELAPTDDDLRAIAEQVWSSYLDPEGVSPLLPLAAVAGDGHVSATVSVTGAWWGHVVIRCSMPGAIADGFDVRDRFTAGGFVRFRASALRF